MRKENTSKGRCILELDGTTDIFRAKEVLCGRMCLMDDVPAGLFKLGTPQQVEAHCQKLTEAVGKRGGLILSSGCEVHYDARFENIKAIFDTSKTYELSKS